MHGDTLKGSSARLLLPGAVLVALWGWGGASDFHRSLAALLVCLAVALSLDRDAWARVRVGWANPVAWLCVLAWVGVPWAANPWLALVTAAFVTSAWLASLLVAGAGAPVARRLAGAVALVVAAAALYGFAQRAGLQPRGFWHNAQFASRFVNGAHFGCLAAVGLCLQAGLLLQSVAWWQRLLWSGAVAVTGAALLLSHSRAAWGLGLAGVGAVVFAEWRACYRSTGGRPYRGLLVLAVGIAMLAACEWRWGIVQGRLHDLVLTRGQSLSQRVDVWRDSLRLVRHVPLGVGAGCFGERYLQYKGGRDRFDAEYAHNEPLQVVAELGWVSVLPLAGLGLAVAWATCGAWRRADVSEDATAGRALSAGTLVFLVHSLVDFPLRLPANLLCLAVVWGALAAVRPQPSGPYRHVVCPAGAVRAGALALACVWVYVCCVDWHWGRALENLVHQRPGAAVPDLEAVSRLAPAHAEAACERGTLYLAWSRLQLPEGHAALVRQAVAELQRAVRWAPYRARSHSLLAEAHAAAGDLAAAESAARRAVALDPQLGRYHKVRADCLLALGRREDAAGEYREALVRFADAPDLYPRRLFLELLERTADPAYVRTICPRDPALERWLEAAHADLRRSRERRK